MKIALLIDGSSVARWQAEAIKQLGPEHQLLVYNCTNAAPGRRSMRHAAYYLLNLISLRTPQARRHPLPNKVTKGNWFDFECRQEGAWQHLPDGLIERVALDAPDLIIKFGMGLLRVPDASQLRPPILSFHHGDPRHYRGRPAGFYELLEGRQAVGQIVQIVSNKLDAGKVVAFAETKTHHHSYRTTMREAFAISPCLLPQAVRAVQQGRTLDIEPVGNVYRLPSSLTVMRFLIERLIAKARRLAYGAFVEKEWQVADAAADASQPMFASFPSPPSWRTVQRPPGYRFLADPFPHPTAEGILVEALRLSSGLGEILHISQSGHRLLLGGKSHFSFPGSLVSDGAAYLVPEISEWSGQRVFQLDDAGRAHDVGPLAIAGDPRLIDPVLFQRDGLVFLFANDAAEGCAVLRLWTSALPLGPFVEHPDSPIRVSPAGSRMGGAIVERNGELYRIGQDFRDGYGDGVLLFRIDEISSGAYREELIDELRFTDFRGPHTVNFTGDSVLFDYYRDRFSLGAGWRRLRSRLSRRPA